MPFLNPEWILAFVCAVVFHRAGKVDAGGGSRHSGLIWAGLSIAVSAAAIRFLSAGWLLVLVSQVLLFVGIGVFRALRDR